MLAQTNENMPCPTLSVTGPPGIVEPNDSAIYTANVDTKGKELKIEYVWSINAGEILQGQGTNIIKVKQPEFYSLVVTVEVKGFPKECPNIASESSTYDPPPVAKKIGEFLIPFSKIESLKNDKLIRAIQDDSTAQLYIIIGYKEKDLADRQTQKERNFVDALAKENKIPADRITIVRIFNKKDSVEFWLVPAGATPPDANKFK